MSWNPSLYLRHGASRLRPALDLISNTLPFFDNPSSVKRIMDLGCGPGNITPALSKAYPEAHIIGIDSSQEMIDAGIKANPDLLHRASFRIGDMNKISELPESDPYQLVYSNAALHWTSDQTIHKRILLNLLSPGGVLAVQMPDTRRQPSHLLMEEAAKNCKFENRLVNVRIPRVEYDPNYYYNLLSSHCSSIDLWSTEYTHLLPYSPQKNSTNHPVAEFTSATGLQPVVKAIRGQGEEGEDRVHRFLTEYNRLLLEAYPATDNGMILFPFKRFFFIAKRK